MKSRVLATWCITAAMMTACSVDVAKGSVASTVLRESIELVAKRFSRETAEIGVETLEKKAVALASQHGDQAVADALRKTGPALYRRLDEVDDVAKGPILKLYAKEGNEAIWISSSKGRTAIFLKHGDEAAEAMLKHREVVEPLIAQHGTVAAKALTAVDSQNARRLVMMQHDGELAAIGRTDELFDVIRRYGDKAADFVWRNKGALAVGAALTAFLANPEPFLDGTADLASIAADAASPAFERAADNLTSGPLSSTAALTWTAMPAAIGLSVLGMAIAIDAYCGWPVSRWLRRRTAARDQSDAKPA